MLFNFALFGCLLLVPVVVAIPFRLAAGIRRGRVGRHSQIIQLVNSNVSNTQESYNWAGAILAKDIETFTSVSGVFTVPTPSGANGTSASVWVGIDGYACPGAILQTGIDLTVSSGNQPIYNAWYEWYPNDAQDFSNITISAGDLIRLNVTAFSPTSGSAEIENLTKRQVVYTSINSSAPLCGQSAEWIVEDYMLGSNLVPFTNFTTVNFTNAASNGRSGVFGPSNATISDIVQNNQNLTTTSINGSSITIMYT